VLSGQWFGSARGPKRLRAFAASRAAGLQRALQSEVVAMVAEARAQPGGDDLDRGLHSQCLKDFDRADFTVGGAVFAQGEAARAGEPDASKARRDFCDRLRATCRRCSEDPKFAFVASALCSQVTMAHLGTVCFSGPHSYALPGGAVKGSYSVRHLRRNQLCITVRRSARDFTSFALPDGDMHGCHRMSFVEQSAEVVLQAADARGDTPLVHVREVREAIRLVWPDERVVVHDDLALDVRSPPAGLGLLAAAAEARRAAMGYAFAPLRLPMEMLRKALGAVAFVIPLAARKTAAATHKQRTS